MQKSVNGKWVNITQENLVNGDVYRIEVGGGYQQQVYMDPVTEPLMVLPKDILQLFPSIAYAELKDYSFDLNNDLESRGNAYKILDILKGGEPLNANSDNFTGLMEWAASVLDNFSQADIDNIMSQLS